MSRLRAPGSYIYQSILSLIVLVTVTVMARDPLPWSQSLTTVFRDIRATSRNPHEEAEFIEDYYGEVLSDSANTDLTSGPVREAHDAQPTNPPDPVGPAETTGAVETTGPVKTTWPVETTGPVETAETAEAAEPDDDAPKPDPPAEPITVPDPPVADSDTVKEPPAKYEEWGTLHGAGLTRPTSGFLEHELRPFMDLPHKGVRVKVNRWGMRDTDYSKEKPPNVFRIAIVGASNTMGSGIPVSKTYPELLEDKLNQEFEAYRRYEVLNFSVSGYQLYDRLYVVENKILDFEPDLILVSLLPSDLNVLYRLLARRIQTNPELHFDFLTRIAKKVRATPLLGIERLRRLLEPHKEELVIECLAALNRIAEDSGVPVAAVVLWLETADEVDDRRHWLVDQPRNQGLIVLRVVETYSKGDLDLYWRPEESDFHPSIKGHRLLADELFERMLLQKQVRRLLMGVRRQSNPKLPKPPRR